MWKSALLSLLFASTNAAGSFDPSGRAPVIVNLVGDDGLTRSLSSALDKALESDATLRPAVANDNNVVSITSNSNVDWDQLGKRTVVIYTVYVFRGEARGEPNVGICYENIMSKCVNDIIRLARIEAEGR